MAKDRCNSLYATCPYNLMESLLLRLGVLLKKIRTRLGTSSAGSKQGYSTMNWNINLSTQVFLKSFVFSLGANLSFPSKLPVNYLWTSQKAYSPPVPNHMSREFGISPVRTNTEDKIIYRVALVRAVLVSCLQLRDYTVLKPNTGWEVIGLVISSSRRKGFVVVGLGFF